MLIRSLLWYLRFAFVGRSVNVRFSGIVFNYLLDKVVVLATGVTNSGVTKTYCFRVIIPNERSQRCLRTKGSRARSGDVHLGK